jgi:hypothetical protein
MADVRLASLIAEDVRDVEGAYDVLRDACLERGLEPLPREGATADRLEGVFARLPAGDQVRIASASVRRLVADVGDRALQAQVDGALDAVDAEPGLPTPDELRNGLFRSWASATGADRRVVWAAWMLLRGSPAIALRTARAIRVQELDAQIALVADAFPA